jgi:hypothetical protein
VVAAPAAAPCPAPTTLLAQAKPVAETLVGDVDGDGRRDRVGLRVAPRARLACGVLLVARTARGTQVARVRYTPTETRPAGDVVRDFRFPLLNGLYRLDRRPGLEMVVTADEGASNSFPELFAIRSGRLLRLRPGLAGLPDGTISWGGFALASEGIDCDRGLVRVTASFFSRRSWRLTRTFYRVGPRRLGFVRSERLRATPRLRRKYEREVSQLRPFPSCHGVAARRQV